MSDEKTPAKKAAAKATVTLRGDSRGHKAGEKVTVPKERAEALVRNGHADPS